MHAFNIIVTEKSSEREASGVYCKTIAPFGLPQGNLKASLGALAVERSLVVKDVISMMVMVLLAASREAWVDAYGIL